MKIIKQLTAVSYAVLGLGLTTSPALATGITAVPEPGVLSLLGVGGAVALVMYFRSRRK
jgi:hypothetical protein